MSETDFSPTNTVPFKPTSIYTTLFGDDVQSTPKSTDDRPPTPGPDDQKQPRNSTEDRPPTRGPDDEEKQPRNSTGERPPTPYPDDLSPNVTTDDVLYQTWDFESTYPWTSFIDTKASKEPKETKEEKEKEEKEEKQSTTKPCSYYYYDDDDDDDSNNNSTDFPMPCVSKSDASDPAKGLRPAIHSAMLPYKQSLGVGSLVLIIGLTIFALLQIPIFKQCWHNFKKQQMNGKSGRILFIFFLVALVLFTINSSVFTYFIFHMDALSDDLYAALEVLAFVPYRLGKLVMHLFFIFRLQFVFVDSPYLQLNKFALWSLIILATIGTLLGCVSSVVGPFQLIHHSPDNEEHIINPALLFGFISLAISIFVEIVVMLLYNQRLRKVVVMQGEVSRKSVSIRSPRRRTRSMVTTETTRSRTEVVELQKPRKSQSQKVITIPMKGGGSDTEHEQQTSVPSQHQLQTSGTMNMLPLTPLEEKWDEHADETDGEGGFPVTPNNYHVGNSTPLEDEDDDLEWEDIEVVETEVSMDKLLLATITKSTLLNLIGILTSLWLELEMLVVAVQGEDDGVLFRAIASFDGGINIICMYLVFSFARPYYNVACKCCHVVLEKCCTSSTKRKIIRTKSVTHT